MPLYRFHCKTCDLSVLKLLRANSVINTEVDCGECGERMIATLGATSVLGKVTIDEYRNKSVDENIEKKLNDRASDRFSKHDLPRIVEKHGKEYAISKGYMDSDGNPKRTRK